MGERFGFSIIGKGRVRDRRIGLEIGGLKRRCGGSILVWGFFLATL